MYKRGFTLLELIIVMVILGILAGLISGNFISSLKKGRDAQRKSDLAQVKNALELFYEDKGTYPTFALSWGNKLCETQSAETCGTEKVYMQKLPKDPKDPAVSYSYGTDANGTYYRLYACLENAEQILSNVSTGYEGTCGYTCKDSSGAAIDCVWGVSSPNTLP